jgi:isopenicillin-N epimerase
MADLKSQFLLDPSITFLNFGSFGSTPKPIFDDYQKWQLEMEREPVQFMAVNGPKYLRKSREALAKYVNCDANDLVYVPNPSYAINVIAKSFDLNLGDEILSTNFEYGALDRTWHYYCKRSFAEFVRQPITLPITTKEKFLEDFWKGYTHKTRAVFIGQITSSTGLIIPVKEICEMAKQKGLFTIVDGAHVPGHIPLNLQEIKADVYTGACHKWMMTPKGCSFLYVKKEHQHLFDPLVVSWGYDKDFPTVLTGAPHDSKFIDYHQMQGTRDFSAFLTVPKAIEFMKENNWDEVSANCRKLVLKNYERVCEVFNTRPVCPVNEEFLGQMCSTPVKMSDPTTLQQTLFDKYKIEIPVMRQGDDFYIRFSVQAYNTQADIDRLVDALKEIIKR